MWGVKLIEEEYETGIVLKEKNVYSGKDIKRE